MTVLLVAVLIGGTAFYGGMKYNQSKTASDKQQRFQQTGANISGGFRGGRSGMMGDFVSGEIISKDDKSITVKMRDGGSKIVFLSNTTEIGKFVNGNLADLLVGKNVTINGKANQDGSITAQSVQIRSNFASPSPTLSN